MSSCRRCSSRLRRTESTASFMLLPVVLVMAIGSPLAGRTLDRTGARTVVLIGTAVLAAGLLMVGGLPISLAVFYLTGVLVGLGLSWLLARRCATSCSRGAALPAGGGAGRTGAFHPRRPAGGRRAGGRGRRLTRRWHGRLPAGLPWRRCDHARVFLRCLWAEEPHRRAGNGATQRGAGRRGSRYNRSRSSCLELDNHRVEMSNLVELTDRSVTQSA